MTATLALAMQRAEPGKHASALLAVAVHVFLAALLIYGIQWQTAQPEAVEVDLVRPTPAPEPARVQEPAPETKPEQKVEPKPEPKAEPVVKPQPALPNPDIALKGKPAFDPNALLRRDAEQLARQQEAATLDRELARVKASRASTVWAEKIRAKIRGNIVRPANVEGNPEAVYEIQLLPDGTVIGDPRLQKSTGNPALDNAIERAIRKSSPLPRPDDPNAFQRVLQLTFRPMED